MNNNSTYSSKILLIQQITADSKLFTIDITGLKLDYKPGQYLVTSIVVQENEYRRSYTIVNFDTTNNTLSFLVKRIDNGLVSRILHDQIQINDTINIISIGGYFTLPEDISDYKQVMLIAAGSGIAPIMPLIESILNNHPIIELNLLYSSKSQQQTIFYKELQNLSSQNNQFTIDYLWSETGNIANSRLNNTLLTKHIHQKITAPFNRCLFFVCGPLDYMDTVSITLLTEGVPKENIRKELYYNYELEELAIPEDTNKYKVTLHFPNGETHKLDVQYPESILNTALKNGLKMPYSCGSGQCGSCTAKCTSGKVWMAYNEVLTERELSQGYVLTCLGFPIEGDVELQF